MESSMNNGEGMEAASVGSTSMWTLPEFMAQYDELGRWLTQIYGAIYGNEQKLAPKAVRTTYALDLNKRSNVREVFNEQGRRLLDEHPDHNEEIMLRLDQLNANWDTLNHALAVRRFKRKESFKPPCQGKDIVTQVKCLRDWLTSMEGKLGEFSWKRVEETRELLEGKLRQHAVLQNEIESQGTAISYILKFCERSRKKGREKQCYKSPGFVFEAEADDEADEEVETKPVVDDVAGLSLAASSLQLRWHRLWLSSLELQCSIEERLQRLVKGGPPSERWSGSDRDEEPLSKYPRLAAELECDRGDEYEYDYQDYDDGLDGVVDDVDCCDSGGNGEDARWFDGCRLSDDVVVNESTNKGRLGPDDGGDVNDAGHDDDDGGGVDDDERVTGRTDLDVGKDQSDELEPREDGVLELLNSSSETTTLDEGEGRQDENEENSMTTDLEVSKEPETRLSSSPIAGMDSNDSAVAVKSLTDEKTVPAGLKPPVAAMSMRDRDKYSPGRLCGSHWLGPNCASFHFKEDAGLDEEEEELEEEGDESGLDKGKKAASSSRQGQTAAQVKVSPATPQSFQQRPKLVARVSPRRRLELDNNEYRDRLAKGAASGGTGSFLGSAMTRKDWWLTSSDSDWLNTEGLSDSDVSGVGVGVGAGAEADRTMVEEEEEGIGGSGEELSRDSERPVGLARSASEGAQQNARPKDLRIPRSCSKHSIHRLVNAADEMVRKDGGGGVPPRTASMPHPHQHRRQFSLPGRQDSPSLQRGTKVDRVTAWLSTHQLVKVGDSPPDAGCVSDTQMGDSCDASGEYTTEDSDSRASPSPSDSEERNSSSVVTCHLQQSFSGGSKGFHGPDTDLDTPVQERAPCLPTGNESKRRRKLSDGALPWALTSQTKKEYGSLVEVGRGKRAKATRGSELDSRWNLSKSDGALNCLASQDVANRPKKLLLNVYNAKAKGHFGSLRTFPSYTLMPQRASSFSGCRPWREVRSARKKDQERWTTPKGMRKKHLAPNWGSSSMLTAGEGPGSLKKSRSFSGRCLLNSAHRDPSLSDPQTPVNPPPPPPHPSLLLLDGGNASPMDARLGPSTEDLVTDCLPATVPEVETLLVILPREEILPAVALNKNDEDTCPSVVEETSSVSEQAWDPYQAPVFADENYSESGMDSEAVKKLLDWDDDYRNALDSLSDATSSVAPPKHANPSVMATVVRRRHGYPGGGGGGGGVQYRAVRRRKAIRQCHGGRPSGDSDSDVDASRTPWDPMNRRSWHAGSPRASLLFDGSPNLSAGESVPAERASYGTPPRRNSGKIPRKKSLDSLSSFDAPGSHKRNSSDPLHSAPCPSSQEVFLQAKKMKDDLEELKTRMQDVEARVQAAMSSGSIRSKEDLSGIVDKLKMCMEELGTQKRVLISLNLDVHFLASAPENQGNNSLGVGEDSSENNAQQLASRLKELVEQLYRRWDDIQHTAGGSVVKMERALCDWQDWENSYTDLMSTLNDEKVTVARASHGWTSTNDFASGPAEEAVFGNGSDAVDGPAGIVGCRLRENKLESTLAGLDARLEKIPSNLEASVGKCEARLRAIEEQGRKVSDALPVKSNVSQLFRQALSQAAEELTFLQANCRRLVTSARVKPVRFSPLMKRRRIPEHRTVTQASPTLPLMPVVQTRLSSFSKRVLRSALPIQAILLAILCIAFFVEPNCCDPNRSSFSSLWLSFSPLVRYNHGPPPS